MSHVCYLTRVRPVNKYGTDGKVVGKKAELEFAQIVDTPNNTANPLAILNEGDERFSQKKPRRAWMIAEPSVAAKMFGFSLESFNSLELSNGTAYDARVKNVHFLELNIKAPKINGTELNIQIVENTTPSSSRQSPKMNPSTGEVMTSESSPIYSHTSIVMGQAKHEFLLSDTQLERVQVSKVESAVEKSIEKVFND
jgi:hypothetical protein